MLISSPRHTAEDLAAWAIHERTDEINAHLWRHRLARMADRARSTIGAFVRDDTNGYLGVSWGKDSVVVAHLVSTMGLDLPAVWVRVARRENPDCPAVRDLFLERHPLRYEEIVVDAADTRTGLLTSEHGYREAAQRHGDRHISGVRGGESADRARRMARWGTTTARTCAPIGHWSADHVYAYIHAHGLPLHPAYAMSMGGRLDRRRLRVSSLGGTRGYYAGRRAWETRYYGRELAALGPLVRAAP